MICAADSLPCVKKGKQKMKKLLVLASAAMLGFAANAGAYAWGIMEPDAEGPDGNTLDTGTAFLFLGAIGQTGNGDGTYALDFSGATYLTSVTAMDDYGLWGQTAYSSSRTSDAFDENDDTPFAVLLIDNTSYNSGNIADYEGDYFLYNGASYELVDQDSGDSYATFFYEDDAVYSTDWKVAGAASADPDPMPEPTSGLLLLLGMAGLALKRKRA